MYERRFHLERSAFAMTPDPRFLLLTPSHREALSGMIYTILQNKGCAMLTGEAGTGKTTLVSHLVRHLPSDKVHFSLMLNPMLNPDEFLEWAMWDFGITDIPPTKVRRLFRLQQFVTTAAEKGQTCVLVVDEAHKLSIELLEEIRLLTNFETAERKLLQILLVGQDELRTMLGGHNLRQLKQRIASRFTLRPLMGSEVEDYVAYRWKMAGGADGAPFEPEAIELIARGSGGIPRTINAICDNALLLVFATEAHRVTAAHIRQVLSDLDIGEPADAPAFAPAVSAQPAESAVRSEALGDTAPEPQRQIQPFRLNDPNANIPRKPSVWARWGARLGLWNLQWRPS